jgi:hypothetical protein
LHLTHPCEASGQPVPLIVAELDSRQELLNISEYYQVQIA